MTNFVQSSLIIHTILANTVKGGDLVVIGELAGVAVSDGDGVNLRAVHLQGVYRLPKGSSTFTQGAKVYWDATNSVTTSTASGNKLIGYAFNEVASADTEVEVALNNAI
ncbi:MAG: DUF2190 family protein [Bacteroidetes bacterium]|nr:DUF2190 family protein [Bacteroidota bacterium]